MSPRQSIPPTINPTVLLIFFNCLIFWIFKSSTNAQYYVIHFKDIYGRKIPEIFFFAKFVKAIF